jgi:cardiolipin synthase A/B
MTCMNAISSATLTQGHQITLLQGSAQYFAALARAIDAAQHVVRMESYIFDTTASGQEVAAALVRAAQRGLRVYLLVDGVGTDPLPAEWRERFATSGVQWRVYKPLGSFGLLIPSRWRRLHRKLCVVDAGTPQALGFCGGINILDDFHDPNHGALKEPRFDFAVQVSGPLLEQIDSALQSLWRSLDSFYLLKTKHLGQAVGSWMSQKSRQTIRLVRPSSMSESTQLEATAVAARAFIVFRDNLRFRNRIEKAYLKAIGGASQEVIIANAYFLPGGKLRKALLQATKRGVRVQLLLQGRYEYFMQYHAARPVYAQLLAAGIEIHEYEASFLHAKVAVVDAYSSRAWATVGSSNLDPLSLLLAREANVVVHDTVFATELRDRLAQAIEQGGKKVDAQVFATRSRYKRFLDRVAYALMRLMLSITGNRY